MLRSYFYEGGSVVIELHLGLLSSVLSLCADQMVWMFYKTVIFMIETSRKTSSQLLFLSVFARARLGKCIPRLCYESSVTYSRNEESPRKMRCFIQSHVLLQARSPVVWSICHSLPIWWMKFVHTVALRHGACAILSQKHVFWCPIKNDHIILCSM